MLKQAREQAGMSLESAAYGLHMDRRTLARIEQAVNPVEQLLVLNMAQVYGQENLPLRYCAGRCPIGRQCGYEIPTNGLAGAVLRLVSEMKEAEAVEDSLIKTTCGGQLPGMALKEFTDVQRAVFALQIAAAQKEAAPVLIHRGRS
ncbi:MAG: hypothetical protein H6Q76_1507 [Firmicutes bacterium]|nr:hypothetical protein [Bacillota bacterium]